MGPNKPLSQTTLQAKEPAMTRTHTRRSQTASIRPRLDALEDRCNPSIVWLDTDADGWRDKVAVTGTDGDETIVIRQNDATNWLSVTEGRFTEGYWSSKIRTVSVDLKGGSDSLTYQLDYDAFYAKDINADLGAGHDTALLSARISSTFYRSVQADLDYSVVAGSGQDRVETDLGRVTKAKVAVVANLGSEDDLFQSVWRGDIYNLGRVDCFVDGESGNDSLYFQALTDANGTGIDITSGSSMVMRLRGSTGNDILEARYSGTLDGHLSLNLIGGSENDQLLTDCTLRFDSDGWLSTFSYGNDGDDVVTGKLYISPGISGLPGTASTVAVGFLMDGGPGYDCVYMYGDTGEMSQVNFECIYSEDFTMVLP
jgi:hypothetical protein